MDRQAQAWTDMNRHEQAGTDMAWHGQIGTDMNRHGQVWTDMNRQAQIWIGMGRHEQAWADMYRHGLHVGQRPFFYGGNNILFDAANCQVGDQSCLVRHSGDSSYCTLYIT